MPISRVIKIESKIEFYDDLTAPYRSLKGKQVHLLPALPNGLHACLIPFPLLYGTALPSARHKFRLTSADGKSEIGLLIDDKESIAAAVDSLVKRGARCDSQQPQEWSLTTTIDKLKVTTSGWAVRVQFNLSNLMHLLAAPEQEYKWVGKYPNGKRTAVPWDGTIHTSRKHWPAVAKRFCKAGFDWEGDDPAREMSIKSTFDASKVAGWNDPAPNSHLLHLYQKEGAEFCAKRGMRALIGDEMGVGKTVQAIAAAEATSAPRIVVVCPANARYVWDMEIRGWGGRGKIQHITNQLDTLDVDARWHIITYDLIAARTETWRLNDEQELAAFSAACPDLVKQIQKAKPGQFPRKVTICNAVTTVPAFSDKKRVDAWGKTMRRLRGELLEQILAAGPMLAILDEAHRVKNKDAKRTKAIQQITAGEAQVLLLTGTPLRNNEHEAAVLLSLLDAEVAKTLSKERGYTIQDVKDCLSYFMIRRTKTEVLPELPEKTRQRIDISNLDPVALDAYRNALSWARECFDKAISDGKSEAEAKQSMQGGIERARTALGIAKVLGGEVADLIVDVVENKECCVVFCAHHEVSDNLKGQLEKEGLHVAVVDGRTSQKDRAEKVKDFQNGRLDVFIGGINAAGEAITLTRADTVIFTELEWVPAAMLQAEDRIHRVGQRSNCQVVQLIARLPDEENLDEMMIDLIGSKVARIGLVLDEETGNIISGSIQTQIRDQLLGRDEAAPIAVSPSAVDPFPLVLPAIGASDDRAGSAKSFHDEAPAHAEVKVAAPSVAAEKRKRGRPKIYLDDQAPSSTERSKQSIKALAASGGKRVMLRLTPDAYEALRMIMAVTGNQQETAAINQALVARKNELLKADA